MGLLDIAGSLFGSKEKGGDVINTTPQWLIDLQKKLGGVVSGGLDSYQPGSAYGGNLNFAGSPTGQEQSSLDMLTKFLGMPGTGGLYDQASGQISDTLSGKYADPSTSPFIQAMSKLAQNNLNDQITQERGTRGARGTYYTDAGVQAEGKMRTRSLDTLNALIGKFSQDERQNMLNAVPFAQQLDQYKNMTVPLQKIGAGQTYGSLSRLIQQANLESQYQDYLRQRTELGNNVNTATTLAVNQPNITPGTMTTPKYAANNDFGNLVGAVNAGGGFGSLSSSIGNIFNAGSGGGGLAAILPMLLGAL